MQTSVEDAIVGERIWSATMTRKFVLPKVHREAEAHARDIVHCRV